MSKTLRRWGVRLSQVRCAKVASRSNRSPDSTSADSLSDESVPPRPHLEISRGPHALGHRAWSTKRLSRRRETAKQTHIAGLVSPMSLISLMPKHRRAWRTGRAQNKLTPRGDRDPETQRVVDRADLNCPGHPCNTWPRAVTHLDGKRWCCSSPSPHSPHVIAPCSENPHPCAARVERPGSLPATLRCDGGVILSPNVLSPTNRSLRAPFSGFLTLDTEVSPNPGRNIPFVRCHWGPLQR